MRGSATGCWLAGPVRCEPGLDSRLLSGKLSTNPNPEEASRPFDRRRDGFVMGEGAGTVVLESLERARARGARIYAELVGFGSTTNAHNLTDPSPDGASEARAMQLALDDASLRPEEIDYVAAHGTSTPKNDVVETTAIKRVFGSHAPRLMVSSNKGQLGHTLSAAGVCNLSAVGRSRIASCRRRHIIAMSIRRVTTTSEQEGLQKCRRRWSTPLRSVGRMPCSPFGHSTRPHRETGKAGEPPMSNEETSNEAILEQFAQVVAESLRIEPSLVTEDAYLDDLGAESLDLLEITMEAEDRFDILIPQKNILQTAQEVFGEGVLVKQGTLTEEGKRFFRRRLPEFNPAPTQEVTVAEITKMFSASDGGMIKSLVTWARRRASERRYTRPLLVAAARFLWRRTDLPSGDDLNQQWVRDTTSGSSRPCSNNRSSVLGPECS